MRKLQNRACLTLAISAITLSGCLSGGGGGSKSAAEPVRAQQERIDSGYFTIDQSLLPFDALGPEDIYQNTSRWSGVHEGAGYRIEVPESWNGMLVMWAHGFRGEGPGLEVETPNGLRRHLLDEGYAWAASSYSTNFYDVRAGIEDTNALALAFNEIAQANGRSLDVPNKYYISGASMGGHIAAAAIERETEQTANHFVPYAGAAPFCGVMADEALFDYFTAYGLALYEVGGVGATSFPVSPEDAAEKRATALDVIWNDYSVRKEADALTTPQGLMFYRILENLSGGERPIYPLSFGGFQDLLQGFLGSDGSIDGITIDSAVDTTAIVYRFQSKPGEPLTAAEQQFNNTILQVTRVSGANGLRDDGLRWIPKVNGDLYADIPVVTAHTLGDLFVPISMQQIYRQRMEENGFGGNLVQRAIRAPSHCDFSHDEMVATFDAMIQWEQNGTVPQGDDLLDPVAVADPLFGCQFTINAAPHQLIRSMMPSCTP